MTRRHLLMEKTENSTAMFSSEDGNNLNSSPSMNVVRVEDNSSISNSGGDFNEPFTYNMTFHPFAAIIILVFFIFFVGLVFLSFCKRRRLTSSGDRRSFRVARGLDNGSTAGTGHGLDRSVIQSFPVFSYNLVKGLKSEVKGSECTVCLTDFKELDMLRLLPICSHAFHPECIDTWLSTNTTCPLCRTSLLLNTDSNQTSTDFGVAGAPLSDEQVIVVADNGSGVSGQGNDFSSEEATIGMASSDPMGHSLIMVQSESKRGNEWYIVTGHGLTPGKYSSFAGKHQPSGSFAARAYCKPEDKSKSERWGKISINPASYLRTFSMRITGGDRDEVVGEGRDRDEDGKQRPDHGSGCSSNGF